jgi:Tol biopolymer transport system component
MGRRPVGALFVLASMVLALTGCEAALPFRLPTLYDGSMEEGELLSQIAPEACPEVRAVLRPHRVFFVIVDQPTGEVLGARYGNFEVTYCRPAAADLGDFELEGSMTFTCCSDQAGRTAQFSGPAIVRRTGSDITVDLDIQSGTGPYRNAYGLCHVEMRMSEGEPPPPGRARMYGRTLSCRIGGPDGPPPPPVLRLVTERVHDAVLGQAYRAPLVAVGGTPPYIWTAPGLPPGLRVEGEAIVGASTVPGQATFEATVRDAAGVTSSRTMTVISQAPEIFGTIRPVSTDPRRLWGGYDEVVSDDGTMVAFVSDMEGLTDPPGQARTDDVFTWDRTTNSMRRITDDVWRNYWSVEVSGDGSTVLFRVLDRLTPEDTDDLPDVYLADTAGGPLMLASPGDGEGASWPAVSDDGQVVVFLRETYGGDDGWRTDVLRWDRSTGTVSTLVTARAAEIRSLHLSDDASRLAFLSPAADLVPGDTNGLSDVFVVELGTGAITRLDTGDGVLYGASLSGDGRTVAFASDTDGFLPPGETDRNGGNDIFRYDLSTSQVVRATNGEFPSHGHFLKEDPSLSDDGGMVLFTSYASDVARGELDLDLSDDAFIWNAGTGVASRLTRLRMSPRSWPPSSRVMTGAQLSGDGRTVVIGSAYDIVDPTDPVVDRSSWSYSYLWTREN